MTSRDKFIKMCHSIYDSIHGKEKIVKIFHPINEEQLNVILQIYNKEFYHRFIAVARLDALVFIISVCQSLTQ